MKLTNRLNLPQALVDAVKNDGYSSNGADFSVTTLLKPPRIVALEREHKEEIEEDASDRIWSLLGQVVHGILERANHDGVSERRLSIIVNGVSISGGMDLYDSGTLQDYKFVTSYKFKGKDVPEEYEQQLNIYAEILRQNNHPVDKLQIVGILRDWSKLEARRDDQYPQSQVVIRDVNLWSSEKAIAFINERVKLHLDARNNLPECSESERWARPNRFAVMKAGAQRAVKLYDNKNDAESHASTNPLLRVEDRPGESIRCAAYCGVAKWCIQYLGAQKKNEVA